LDGEEELSSDRRSAAGVAGIYVCRALRDDAYRQRDLSREQGRLSDALEKGPEAAKPAVFPGRRTITRPHETKPKYGGTSMTHRALIATATLAAALMLPLAAAQAFDESKYPDWSGAWRRLAVPGVTGQPGYDQTKRLGRGQQAPL